jgi:hypothetical protein
MLRLKYIIVMIMLAGSMAEALGQFTGAVASLEKNSILIGDQVKLQLNLTLPAGSRVQWPMLLDTIAQNVEILRKSGIDTVNSDKDKFTIKQELIITSFDSGSFVIHPVIFKYNHPGDTVSYYTETLPVTLDVQTIQTDQAADIKAIKPPLNAPVTFREILPWILIFLLIAGIAALLYYYFKMRKTMPPVVTSRLSTAVPPYEAAIDALESLRLKKLWQAGQVKEYYSELTEIVREYIELRYPIRAMEMTTGEIYYALKKVDVRAPAREKLNQILVLSDLVKFAKEQPLPLDNEQSLDRCMEFVRETKPGKETETAVEEQNVTVEQHTEK